MNENEGLISQAEVRTAHLFDLRVRIDRRLNFGDSPIGRRVFYGVEGGHFEGARLRGEVIAGGGDWARYRHPGSMAIDARLALTTSDGALIEMSYGGRMILPEDLAKRISKDEARATFDPDRYYFRTTPLFETTSEKYAWLNEITCVGVGSMVEGGVAYAVHQIL